MNYYNKLNVKFLSVISYIGPLFVIGKFSLEKNCDKVKFHVKQGEILFYLMSLLIFISIIIDYAFSFVWEYIGILCFLAKIGVSVMWIILAILGMISAFSDSKAILPVVGNLANRLNKEG